MAQANNAVTIYQAEQEELLKNEDAADAFGISSHPCFKLLAFWHSQKVLGIESVAHHA